MGRRPDQRGGLGAEPPRQGELRIGVVGDVHGHWRTDDRRWFDAADYHLLLFVGDLASYLQDGQAVARRIRRLQTPALVMLGNHDGVTLPQLAFEAFGGELGRRVLGRGQQRRARRIERALSPVAVAGYSLHRFVLAGRPLTVLGARPHSMGGSSLSFRRYLAERYGVATLEQSARRLMALVDRCDTESLLFLAHNGPTGLGSEPHDLWGCDFRPELGDFGDADLRRAVDHARGQGRRVVAVVAGHMHHAVRGGGGRRWCVERDDVVYVNAARVPRIVRRRGRLEGHHVLLRITEDRTRVEPVWAP